MILWILGGLALAIFLGAFTVVWWKIGDLWADDEYKKFGHGGGGPKHDDAPTVISGFEPDRSGSNHRDAG